MTKFGLGFLLLAIGCLATAADSPPYESALAQGNRLLEKEKYADAAEVLDEAIESLRAEQGGDSIDTVHLLLPAAKAYAGLGRNGLSYRYFDTAFELLEESSSVDKADLVVKAFSTRKAADSTWDERRRAKQLGRVYDIAMEVLGDKDLRTASMATELGMAAAYQERRKEAVTYLDQAYTILKNVKFVDPDPIGIELQTLAAAYFRIDRLELGDELLKIAMAIGASTDGPVPILRVAPMYPRGCLLAAIDGEVSLIIGVGDRGRVQDVKVTGVKTWRGGTTRDPNIKSCRTEMEQAAVEAASQFRYVPGFENGLPVATEGFSTTMSFEIE